MGSSVSGVLAAVVLCSLSPLFGQPCLPVEIGNLEGNYIVPGTWGEIVYREVDGQKLALDAYIQQGGETRPAVIVIHGGNWTTGSRVTYVSQFLEMLTAAGFNWFSIDYRLAPRSPLPAALEDLRAALEFVRCNASHFQIDPQRIALLGDDAGGHLAALLATQKPDGVRAVVTFGSPFDLRSLNNLGSVDRASRLFESVTAENLDQVLERYSPMAHIRGDMAPVMAVYGTADSQVPPDQSRDFCRALRESGGDCELRPVEGGIHLPENWPPRKWEYKEDVTDWLRAVLELESEPGPPYQTRLRKDIVYGTYQDQAGTLQPLLMDYYQPAGPGPFPAVILVHGGGWEAGNKITYLTPVLKPLAEAGFAWFSIDYRLTPEFGHPEQLNDLRRAIRFVRHNAARFAIDPARIALLGESAGGQMVAQLATEACLPETHSDDLVERESCRVAAVVSFYGVYDFLSMVENASPDSLLVRLFDKRRLDEEARQLLKRYSPLYHVHSEMPPMLLINGTAEQLWPQALRFKQVLEERDVTHELYRLEGAPHGMENWEGHPEWRDYKDHMVGWLEGVLGRAGERR